MTVRDLVVVGGGIAGLVVAHDAARAGLSVELLESDDRTGGMVRPALLGGVSVDVGAESFATRTAGVAELLADVAPELRATRPGTGGAHLAFLDTPGEGAVQIAPLPRRTVLGIPADPLADDVVRIIGPAAAEHAAAERSMPAPRGPEPSLAELVAERCGAVLARRLVDPLCRSVYSRPASAVRLSQLNPALWRAFTAGGSLLAAAASVADGQRAGSAVAGITGGVWQLPAAVHAAAVRHGAVLRTGVVVAALDAVDGLVHITTADGDKIAARRVVVATGTAAARALLAPADPAPVAAHARVRVIAALVHAPGLDGHPVGTGVIVAPDVPGAAKALTHVTAKWEWAAAAPRSGGASRHIVRLSARDADAAGLDTPAEIAGEIARLTGIPADTVDVLDVVDRIWTDAVAAPPVDAPQAAALARTGIHLAGAAAAGTGLASIVPHARALARELTSAPSSAASQGRVHV
ncbi:protoporphyrinogen/coproporphyrinogen oxidase [Microbacterium sp. MC2]